MIRFGVLSYWDNSYWGGALAATGGALLLGALPRILKHQRMRDSILMALGIAILANTRPYEGFMLTLVVGARLVIWVIRDKPAAGPLLRRVALPAILVLAVAGSATGYYFWRVTGNPLTMPQQVNRETYAMARYFYWQTAYAEPAYHHKAIRDFYNVELSEFNGRPQHGGDACPVDKNGRRDPGLSFSPRCSALPLLFLPRIVRDRRIRFLDRRRGSRTCQLRARRIFQHQLSCPHHLRDRGVYRPGHASFARLGMGRQTHRPVPGARDCSDVRRDGASRGPYLSGNSCTRDLGGDRAGACCHRSTT